MLLDYVQADKDFDGQIVESVDIANCVSILIDGSCE